MAVSVTNLSAKYGMENWFCQRKWFLVTNPYFSKLSAIGIKYKVGWGLGCKSKERWKGKHCSLARKERISCNRGKGRWDWNGEIGILWKPFIQGQSRQSDDWITGKRKKSIGKFEVPQCTTLEELLEEYVRIYGHDKWGVSTYAGNISLNNNYILPTIGKVKLSSINTHFMEKYYKDLLEMPAVKSSKIYLWGDDDIYTI